MITPRLSPLPLFLGRALRRAYVPTHNKNWEV